MEVTSEMQIAAVRQAIKEGLLPSHEVAIETYEAHYEAIKRILEAAIDESFGEG